MKNGFIISIGCSRKKYKLNQRFEPLTSIPINGTKAKAINNIMKTGIMVFLRYFNSTNDIKTIVSSENNTKIKCFEKKK